MIAGVELAHFLGMLPGDELGLPSASPNAPAMKLVGTKLASQLADTASKILGQASVLLGDEAPDAGAWANAWLTAPGIHIAGGTGTTLNRPMRSKSQPANVLSALIVSRSIGLASGFFALMSTMTIFGLSALGSG